MSKNWPLVALSEVLSLDIDAVPVDPTKAYPMTGVYSFGRGLIDRKPLDGSNTTYRFLHRLHKDQYVLSQVKGWEGAVARVTEAFEGRHLSPHFPTFRANSDKLEISYLEWYCKQPKVWEALRRKSHGIGARREVVPPEKFLSLEIPLPPLDEQRRIVARIETLAAKVEQAQRLRQKSVGEVDAILMVARRKLIGDPSQENWVPLSKFVKTIENGKSPDCEKRPASRDEWGVLKVGAVSFGYFNPQQNKALPAIMKPNLEYQVCVGDFLMNRANTRELVGACAIVEKTPPNLLLSDKIFRFIFREDEHIDHRYLNQVLKSPALRTQIEQKATGTSPTMKNVSKEKVLQLKIPNPPLSEQHRIVAYLDNLQAKVEEVKQHQAATAARLEALLPSILDRAFRGEL